VVLGGDVVDCDNGGQDYAVIERLFSPLNRPVHLVLGNHDRLETFKRTAQSRVAHDFPGYYSFDARGYHVVLLCSGETGTVHGLIDEEQLRWFDADLDASHPRPTLVFMHHPPVFVGIPPLDRVNLQNMSDFWEIVDRYPDRLCGVFVGHIHQQISCVHRGVLVASCPATSIQISNNADATKIELCDDQPGFNLLDLTDGQVTVRTVRFDPYSFLANAPPCDQSGKPVC
jgi:3',5'-cyclic AMP phosphodiesterase CpdA